MARRQFPHQELARRQSRRARALHHGGGLRQLSGNAGALISWKYDQGADPLPLAEAPRRAGPDGHRHGSRQVRHPEDQGGGFPRRPDRGIRRHAPAARRGGSCAGRRRNFGTGRVGCGHAPPGRWWCDAPRLRGLSKLFGPVQRRWARVDLREHEDKILLLLALVVSAGASLIVVGFVAVTERMGRVLLTAGGVQRVLSPLVGSLVL